MSAIKSVPDWVNRQIVPAALILAITRLGAVPPVVKFKFDAVGWGWSHGQTVTNPLPVASVPVTLSTTAEAVTGTLVDPVAVTFKVTVCPAAGVAPTYPFWPGPDRVSNKRSGSTGTKLEPPGKYPLMSAIKSVPDWVNRHGTVALSDRAARSGVRRATVGPIGPSEAEIGPELGREWCVGGPAAGSAPL